MSERSDGPTRRSDSLADVVEMLLDKGVVINADIAVSVGDTELLGVQLRAALASFETAAEYGLEFPDGTDMRRVEAASDRTPIKELDEERDDPPIGESGSWLAEPPITSDEDDTDDGAPAPSEPGVGARPRIGGRSRADTEDDDTDEEAADTDETDGEADDED